MSGWRGAGPELAVGIGLVLLLTIAAWVIDGPTIASVVVLVSVAASLVMLRALLIGDDQLDEHGAQSPAGLAAPDSSSPLGVEQIRLSYSFTSFWQTQSDLGSATKSLSAWDYGTRPRLTNLLAARLSEHHEINLAHEPQRARRLLLGPDDRDDLWYWIDPRRPSPPDASSQPGIPPPALAALIERLEKL